MKITTTITKKGQVTIPVSIREILDLKASDSLLFSLEKNKIIATPVKSDVLSLYGSVKVKTKQPVNFKKLRQKMIKELAKKAVNNF